MTIDKQALRQLATDAHELGIIKRHSKGLEAQRKFYAAATPLVIRALLDEMEALQSFRAAFNEWHDKTEWVQVDKRFDAIKPWGKHRADVLKLYIDHLESKLEAAKQDSAKWFKAFEKAVSIGARYEERIAEQQRSLDHREFLLLSADQVQREYAEALGCAGDNESLLEAIDGLKEQVRTVDLSNGVLNQRIAELESRTVTLEPFRSFVTDADIAALHRFAECCDDPESGGHDLEKEQVRRLEAIGALQRSGRISYITGFGDVLISITAGIGKGE
ncbi:hypothetical protein [Citrobacter koseri]|uniref:hypothetical protein n=1 Tax=Citrobacter koseri TaxID=545 RepID=UPI002943B9E7|nr:hypothetical protein [Citrobacter koseri]WOI99627.1 hypothetical protein R1158_05640 [Citrobacter koseri]